MKLFAVILLSVCIPYAVWALETKDPIIPCGGPFDTFVDALKTEAMAMGFRRSTVNSFFKSVQHDPQVIKSDRNQGVFRKSFIEFSKLVMSEYRIVKGKEFAIKYARELDDVHRMFGVPQGVLLSFLALETDYGLVQGDFNTLNALVTLSHDCRRPSLFQPHVFGALQLYLDGNFSPERFRGAWAGEIGMIQMLPNDIVQFGIDQDRDGRIDLRSSVADALMTAGKVLNSFGWQPNQPWLLEVTVPRNLDWEDTGSETFKTLDTWKQLGVRIRNEDWPRDQNYAALLIPHGRLGPAFLAFPNYLIYLEWNQSFVYTTTSAFFATLLSGSPMYRDGSAPPQLPDNDLILLQTLLTGKGYDVGKIDGIIGSKTRNAVRSEQVRLGLPADAWPTSELLSILKKGG